MTKDFIEIKDQKIIKCIRITNEWYAFCELLINEIGIKNYSLWIGSIRWGYNEDKNVTAILNKNEIYFQIGEEEKSFDLVSAIIHAWFAGEPIILQLNEQIQKTVNLLFKNSEHNEWLKSIYNDYLWSAPYKYHNGTLG